MDLIGRLKFRVPDSDILRFMPIIEESIPQDTSVVEQRGAIWNEVSLPGTIGGGTGSKFELLKCSGAIESNLFMSNTGIKCNQPEDLKIKENTIEVMDGPAVEIITAGEAGIRIQDNTIKAENGPTIIIRPTDDAEVIEIGSIRVSGNSLSSVGYSAVGIMADKVIFINNICKNNINSYNKDVNKIYPIYIAGNDITFSNNQCTLLPPDNATLKDMLDALNTIALSIEHVHIESESASVIGNRCIEDFTGESIISIIAKSIGGNEEALLALLIGNITRHQILPEPRGFNLEG